MKPFRGLLGVLAGLALLACNDAQPLAPAPDLAAHRAGGAGHDDDDDRQPSAEGRGHYDIQGLDVVFDFEAEQRRNGTAKGEFRIRADEGGGLLIDFSGKVTCLSVDPVNHRAWIGGVVKRNRSTDPDLQTDIHQHGRDIWFRVLDMGRGAGVIDRSTFVGFTGAAGFQTSADYCAGRPWPDDNARTWPVTSGGIRVRP